MLEVARHGPTKRRRAPRETKTNGLHSEPVTGCDLLDIPFLIAQQSASHVLDPTISKMALRGSFSYSPGHPLFLVGLFFFFSFCLFLYYIYLTLRKTPKGPSHDLKVPGIMN
ncbi:hypothetical protein SODALDRAFT_130018 [Sodiomyces alkalinus F11]|uniref:Uncharacterized protein n=1 Tax=Sodiomyces alkalinus (strain CBS 110278 / VKM F-3762 / F11) TaxID=1314773 RepID=A0A3N2PIH1_SODAK|nr:hypothetical protein SODALDRAFT_130018 [Sodiomyces alkalinus F11]ROT34442.1 hypothetical protein SODALDRAFT_130018 [Sodiomyces alkalinus F11]